MGSGDVGFAEGLRDGGAMVNFTRIRGAYPQPVALCSMVFACRIRYNFKLFAARLAAREAIT